MLRGCFQGEGAPRLAERKRQAHQATPPSVPGGEPDVQECSPASRLGQGGGWGKAPCPSLGAVSETFSGAGHSNPFNI